MNPVELVVPIKGLRSHQRLHGGALSKACQERTPPPHDKRNPRATATQSDAHEAPTTVATAASHVVATPRAERRARAKHTGQSNHSTRGAMALHIYLFAATLLHRLSGSSCRGDSQNRRIFVRQPVWRLAQRFRRLSGVFQTQLWCSRPGDAVRMPVHGLLCKRTSLLLPRTVAGRHVVAVTPVASTCEFDERRCIWIIVPRSAARGFSS